MEQKNLSELTDEELLQAAKKMKSTAIMNAFLIGFLVGIVIYSVVKSTWGLVTLFPLYFAYRLINKSKYPNQELEAMLRSRNLK